MKILRASALAILIAMSSLMGINAQNLKPIAQMVHKQMDNQNAPTKRIFGTASQTLEPSISKVVEKGTLVTLDFQALNQLMAQNSAILSLNIPFEGEELTLDLVQVPNLTEDFVVKTSTSKNQPVKYERGLYYRGIIHGDDQSIAAISFFKNELFAVISDTRHGNIVVGKMENNPKLDQYIIYSDKNLRVIPDFKCGTEEATPNQSEGILPTTAASAVGGCVRVYYELDYGTYTNRGSSVANSVNYITACYNNVAALYANESISTMLSEVFVWQTQDTYPTTSSAALSAIRTARPTFNGDLAHLVSLRTSSSFSGVAYLFSGSPYTVLCSGSKYAYSQTAASFSNVPTYSWTIEVLTHEMGHNMGSPHTQSCSWPGGAIDGCVAVEDGSCARPALPPAGSGTIMSYCHQVSTVGINFNNGFGPLPGARIRTAIGLVTCLNASCSTTTCVAPTTPSVSSITSTGSTVSWTAVSGAVSYKVEYKTTTATTWTVAAAAATSTSFNLTGLVSSTAYNVQVTTNCSSGSSIPSPTASFTTSACVPTIPAAPSVSAITSNSATVSWAAVAGAVSYRVEYKQNAAATWTVINTTSTSVNLTGLTFETLHNVRIYSFCSATTMSAASTVTNFTTGACIPTTPTAPSVSAITSTSATVSWAAVSGAVSYRVEYKQNAAATWTIINTTSTSVNLTGLPFATLHNARVYSFCSATTMSTASTITNFTTGACIPTTPAAPLVSAITSTSATVNWASVAGAVSYRVEYKQNAAATWTVINTTSTSANLTGLSFATLHNVRVYSFCDAATMSAASTITNFTTSACVPITPTAPSVSAITSTSATVTWAAVAGAVSYRVEYKQNTAATWTVINTTLTSVDLTNLSFATLHNVRISSFCSATTMSAASPITNFTTAACVPTTPNAPTVSAITSTSATVSWAAVAGAVSYRVEYKQNAAATWTVINTTSTSANLTGLSFATVHNVRIYSFCSAATMSVASTITNFTTANCVPTTPAAPLVSAITSTSATVSWGAVSGAISYRVEYKQNTAATWTVINTTSTSANLTGLTFETLHNVRIYSFCSAATMSAASTITNFTTAACIPTTPTAPSVSAITLSSATVGWAAVTGAVGYRVEYKQNTAATWTVINTTATSVNLTGLSPATVHNVRVYSFCSGVTMSTASATINFTTTVPCSDANEPNNTIAAAKTIGVNSITSGSISIAGDDDYFRITTTAPLTNVVVILTQLNANFDLELYNSASVKIGTSVRTGALSESISLATTAAGTYYIRVFGVNGEVHQSCYQLTVLADNSVLGCPSTSAAIANFSSTNNGTDAAPSPKSSDKMALNLFPNPAKSVVNLSVSTIDEGEYEVNFYDMMGKKVIINKSTLAKGDNQLSVPTENLVKGTYLVRVFKGKESVASKVIIE